MERLLIDDAAKNALQTPLRAEVAVLALNLLQEASGESWAMDGLIPDRSTDCKLAIANPTFLRYLEHRGPQFHVTIELTNGRRCLLHLFLDFSSSIRAFLALLLCLTTRLTIRHCLTKWL